MPTTALKHHEDDTAELETVEGDGILLAMLMQTTPRVGRNFRTYHTKLSDEERNILRRQSNVDIHRVVAKRLWEFDQAWKPMTVDEDGSVDSEQACEEENVHGNEVNIIVFFLWIGGSIGLLCTLIVLFIPPLPYCDNANLALESGNPYGLTAFDASFLTALEEYSLDRYRKDCRSCPLNRICRHGKLFEL